MIPSGSIASASPTVLSSSSGAPQSPTVTTTHTLLNLELPRTQTPDGTLRLRGGPIHSRRVTWSEEVIDNEGLGRKKSKVCCIFKRNREFGESSDESSSDSSDSSDDSDIGDGKRKEGEDGNKKSGKCHDHGHSHSHSHHGRRNSGRGNRRRPPSPNAYERMPRNSTKKNEDSTKFSGGEPSKQLS